MKGTTLFLFCVTAIVYADIEGFYDNGCPRDTSVSKLLPHKNCNQFYQCFKGKLVPRFCPSGLHFDADLESCDWYGDNVKCNNKRESPDSYEELDNNNPKHAALICSFSDSNGVLVAHENCNEFYKCSNGKPVVLKCARNLLFNPLNEKCDSSHNVHCGDRIVVLYKSYTTIKSDNNDATYSIEEIDNINSNTSRTNSLCASKQSEGMLFAHENCDKYYKCTRGDPVTIKCPENLRYNPMKKQCDWLQNVDCNDRSLIDNNVSNSLAGNEENSGDNEENETSGNDENNAADICAAQHSDGIKFIHEMCNQFYKCIGSHAFTFNCPRNLLFNEKTKNCDWSKNVNCGNRILSDDTGSGDGNDNQSSEVESVGFNNDPSQVIALCSAQGSDGVLVAHERCDYFYQCQDGNAIELKCPGNLLYRPGKEYCDWPTYVDCADRTVSENVDSYENNIENESDNSNEGDQPQNSLAAICAAENSDGTLIAHENCNQFYKCFEGKAVTLSCQLHLYFNIRGGYCDWPHNVNCGPRAIPGITSINEDDGNNPNTPCSGFPDGDIIPHENCNQFYKCNNGKTYPMDCPPGLYFNTLLKVCDWPMNVDCGKRLAESVVYNKHAVVRRTLGVMGLP